MLEDFFNNQSFDESDRRNHAFSFVRAIREIVTISKRLQQPLTYEKTIDAVYDMNPKLYKVVNGLLPIKNESETVRYFKQKAEAKNQGVEGLFKVSPEQLLKEEIKEHNELLKNASDNDYKLLKRKIKEYEAALRYFAPRRVSEHKILIHDYNNTLASQHKYFAQEFDSNEEFKDFTLQNDKILRLRLYHPDKPEHITGTDVVYEIFDLLNERVRFIHLQYKIWDDKKIYLNSGNIKSQMLKMNSVLCQSGYCNSINQNNKPDDYRLPYCCAFFRPTDRIMYSDSKLKSSGYHVPMCEMFKHLKNNGQIAKKEIASKSISNKIFEDLFILNLAGSRWISMKDLDKFYMEKGLNSFMENINLRAQEVQIYSEEKMRDYQRKK